MATQQKKKKAGRPAIGAPVTMRPPDSVRQWLDGLTTRYGVRQADVLRMILEDAQADKWTPAASMERRASAK